MIDIAIALIVGLFCGAWAYEDAKKRKSDHKELAGILGFMLGIVGVIIWLIIRPKETKNDNKKRKR